MLEIFSSLNEEKMGQFSKSALQGDIACRSGFRLANDLAGRVGTGA